MVDSCVGCLIEAGEVTYSGRASILSVPNLPSQGTTSTSVVSLPSGGVCVSPDGDRICVCGWELSAVASARPDSAMYL